MFSTLLGALPPSDAAEADSDEAIRQNVSDLDAAGLELLSSGLPPARAEIGPEAVVAQWRTAAASTIRAVKQVVAGPYSAGPDGAPVDATEMARRTRPLIEALVDAGCPLIEIDEPAAGAIADDASERERFTGAHRVLVDGLAGGHLSLTLTGGNLDAAGAATFFDLPYASFAFDLIAGPENWRLIAVAPTDRGVICGALDPRPDGDETRELLVWAGHYAASTAGRGIDRVGLANASSLAGLPRAVALRKLARVAESARIAATDSAEELAAVLDPRAFARRRSRGAGAIRFAEPGEE